MGDETVDPRIVVHRRVFAPDADARALVAEVRVTNPTRETLEYGLVEFWDPNLHQVALELLTSDLLQPGITDGIERRRRALDAGLSQGVSWDPVSRVAVVDTVAGLPAGFDATAPSLIDWLPDSSTGCPR
jgi:hypothetical protein